MFFQKRNFIRNILTDNRTSEIRNRKEIGNCKRKERSTISVETEGLETVYVRRFLLTIKLSVTKEVTN